MEPRTKWRNHPKSIKQINWPKKPKKPHFARNVQKSSTNLGLQGLGLTNGCVTNYSTVDNKQLEINEISEIIKKTNFRVNNCYSKSLITPYIPLSKLQKVKEISDMDECSSNRFTEYSNIFETIKREISSINNLHIYNYKTTSNNIMRNTDEYIEETDEEDRQSWKFMTNRKAKRDKCKTKIINDINWQTNQNKGKRLLTERHKKHKNYIIKLNPNDNLCDKEAKDIDEWLCSTEENKQFIQLSNTGISISIRSIHEKNKCYRNKHKQTSDRNPRNINIPSITNVASNATNATNNYNKNIVNIGAPDSVSNKLLQEKWETKESCNCIVF